jgi:hypothetical protein
MVKRLPGTAATCRKPAALATRFQHRDIGAERVVAGRFGEGFEHDRRRALIIGGEIGASQPLFARCADADHRGVGKAVGAGAPSAEASEAPYQGRNLPAREALTAAPRQSKPSKQPAEVPSPGFFCARNSAIPVALLRILSRPLAGRSVGLTERRLRTAQIFAIWLKFCFLVNLAWNKL